MLQRTQICIPARVRVGIGASRSKYRARCRRVPEIGQRRLTEGAAPSENRAYGQSPLLCLLLVCTSILGFVSSWLRLLGPDQDKRAPARRGTPAGHDRECLVGMLPTLIIHVHVRVRLNLNPCIRALVKVKMNFVVRIQVLGPELRADHHCMGKMSFPVGPGSPSGRS